MLYIAALADRQVKSSSAEMRNLGFIVQKTNKRD
jgi:hypothetical protein